MFFHFQQQFPRLKVKWDKYLPLQKRKELPAKSVLLKEGEVSRHYIFIESGAVRTYFNNKGVDKTVQFFFENEGLASLESFMNNTPSQFTIETLEPSVVYLLAKKHVLELFTELGEEPGFMDMMFRIFGSRQTHYINEFVSFIRDTPEERYLHLLRDNPHIIQRVPQHYIASYLGVSAVHLSRIKNKVATGKKHF